jgi:signal peptidase I
MSLFFGGQRMEKWTSIGSKYFSKSFFRNLRSYIVIALAAIVFAILMRIFLFASFKVPSLSMFPALLNGDYILVNKQIPGPRVYSNLNHIRINGKVQTRRFKGIRAIRRNDIIVFNYPFINEKRIEMNLNVNYLKRCVAVPGDTFYIENGIYKVKNCPDSLGCLFRQKKLVNKSQQDFPSEVWRCFPKDTVCYKWNIKNFGPLYVPKKGDNLTIDSINYILYRKLITYETDKAIKVCDGKVLLGDSVIDRYTFKMNYYFMAGDHVFDSRDSRYWGLLPEDHIIGKAIFIRQSKDKKTGKRRWERFLRTIN